MICIPYFRARMAAASTPAHRPQLPGLSQKMLFAEDVQDFSTLPGLEGI